MKPEQGKTLKKTLLIFCILFLICGCSSIHNAKPIWTTEGWTIYKDEICSTLFNIGWIAICGAFPSLIGYGAYKGHFGKILNTIGFIVVSTIAIICYYFGHWGWAILPIPAWFLGMKGLLLSPLDKD